MPRSARQLFLDHKRAQMEEGRRDRSIVPTPELAAANRFISARFTPDLDLHVIEGDASRLPPLEDQLQFYQAKRTLPDLISVSSVSEEIANQLKRVLDTGYGEDYFMRTYYDPATRAVKQVKSNQVALSVSEGKVTVKVKGFGFGKRRLLLTDEKTLSAALEALRKGLSQVELVRERLLREQGKTFALFDAVDTALNPHAKRMLAADLSIGLERGRKRLPFYFRSEEADYLLQQVFNKVNITRHADDLWRTQNNLDSLRDELLSRISEHQLRLGQIISQQRSLAEQRATNKRLHR